MSSWDYRIFKDKKSGVHWIGEAYYDENDEFDGGYTDTTYNPLSGESLEELLGEIDHIKVALVKPILEVEL